MREELDKGIGWIKVGKLNYLSIFSFTLNYCLQRPSIMGALSFPINKKLTSAYYFAAWKAVSNIIKALQRYFRMLLSPFYRSRSWTTKSLPQNHSFQEVMSLESTSADIYSPDLFLLVPFRDHYFHGQGYEILLSDFFLFAFLMSCIWKEGLCLHEIVN